MMTLTVCIGSSCHLKGSYNVVTELENLIQQNNLENKVTLQASFCSGNCTNAVCIKLNDDPIMSVSPENIKDFFNENILKNL
jgi:NADH:ubiquinone oxidoreductase subunit E